MNCDQFKLLMTILFSFAFLDSLAVGDDLVAANFLTPSFSKDRNSPTPLECRLDLLISKSDFQG